MAAGAARVSVRARSVGVVDDDDDDDDDDDAAAAAAKMARARDAEAATPSVIE